MFFFGKNNKKNSDSQESKLEAAVHDLSEGDKYIRQRDFAEAEKWYMKSISALEPLAQRSESADIRRELSRAYSMMSVVCRMVTDEKKRSQAAVWLKKSVEIDEKLAKSIGTPKAYDDLACSYSGLGGSTLDITYCEKALAIWQELHRKYPQEHLYVKRIEDEQFNIRKLKEYISRTKKP